MSLKRTLWTTEEVIHLLDGCKLFRTDGTTSPESAIENQAIDRLKDFFYDFKRPAKEFGAIAYDPETDTIFHIGDIPR